MVLMAYEGDGGVPPQIFFKDFVYILSDLLLLLFQVPRITIFEKALCFSTAMGKLKNFKSISRM